MTDQPNNQRKDMRAHRVVTLPIMPTTNHVRDMRILLAHKLSRCPLQQYLVDEAWMFKRTRKADVSERMSPTSVNCGVRHILYIHVSILRRWNGRRNSQSIGFKAQSEHYGLLCPFVRMYVQYVCPTLLYARWSDSKDEENSRITEFLCFWKRLLPPNSHDWAN